MSERRTPHPLADLAWAPELALLHVLENTIATTRLMLLIETPELSDPEYEYLEQEPSLRRVHDAVCRMSEQLDALLDTIAAYRRALRHLRDSLDGTREFPF
jgi:hypothetical protein